ncbi:hypothetical protein [Streptomyces sp. NPDC007100]|uniref:hypothetical protein n=1 Tax=Streptomyces sp. NPDC007100 TaxID=3155602 RepID=UPI0033EB8394
MTRLSTVYQKRGSRMGQQGNVTGLEGHVYVVSFESGLIKVGRSKSPTDRLRKYRQEGVIHVNPVAESWVSPLHAKWSDNEEQLIRFCEANGTMASNGYRGEYFTGLSFEQVRSYAEGLPFDRLDQRKHVEENAWLVRYHRQLAEQFNNPPRMALPPKIKVCDLIQGDLDDPERQEVDGRLAAQLEISPAELRGLPSDLQNALDEYVVEFVNLRQDKAALADALDRTQKAMDGHVTDGFRALQEKIWTFLDARIKP